MSSIYETTCNSCGHEFQFTAGNGFYFTIYRCEDCGKRKRIDHPEVRAYRAVLKGDQIGKCEVCGGKLSENANPKCPKCKSSVSIKDEDYVGSID